MAVRVAPDAVLVDASEHFRVLVVDERVHPLVDDLLRVDEQVDLLRVEPALGVLVAVALDADVAVDGHELDVAVARLEHRVDRPDLVLARVPAPTIPHQPRPGPDRERERTDQ